MEEVKTPNTDKKSMWTTLISFGVYVLFFLFFCIGLVSLGGESFGAGEIMDYIKDPKLLISDMLIDSIKALFNKNATSAYIAFALMRTVFIIYAMVIFVIFVIKAIIAVVSVLRAVTGSVEWDKAEEKMSKKLRSCVHTLVGFIIMAYLMIGKEMVDLEAGAFIFIIVGTLYIVGKDAWDQKELVKTAPLKFALDLAYDIAKIVLAIVALTFLLTWPLIYSFVDTFKQILLDLASKVEVATIIKVRVLNLAWAILVLIAVMKCKKVMGNLIKGDEEKAKKISSTCVVLSIIAAVICAVIAMAILPEKMAFKDWWTVYGKDFLKIIIFTAIACAVYQAPKAIALLDKSEAAPEAEAEVAATEEDAE